MKRQDLSKAELACLEYYETPFSDWEQSALGKKIHAAGKAIAEQLKPKLKPVDMSVLIDSGIDCEFTEVEGGDYFHGFSPLSAINGHYGHCYESNGVFSAAKCKPRMNYWFSDYNFDSLPDLLDKLRDAGFLVDVVNVDGFVEHFQIEGLKDGYCWPWECKNGGEV